MPAAPGRHSPAGGPEVTVRADPATGVEALHAVVARPGVDPVRLARAVAAEHLDGAGMVVVEVPVLPGRPVGPRAATPGGPAGARADDGLDLVWIYRDLADRPPMPRPIGPARIGADPALSAGLVAELAASLAERARYCGLADLLPDDRVLRARARALLGPVRWAGLRRDEAVAYVLWQLLVDPFRHSEVVDLVDICGSARGVTELLLAHVAATERARRVRGSVAVSPAEPPGWLVLRTLCVRGWTVGAGRWRFAVAGEEVLSWRAAPLPWRRAALAAAARVAG